VPAAIDPATAEPPISQMTIRASDLGGPVGMKPAWVSSYTLTAAQVKAVCQKHLTAVFLDWSNVPYNQGIESAVRNTFNALGIRLLRITDYNFDPSTTLSSQVSAAMALNPNIILTGGGTPPQQMASLFAPAVAKHVLISTTSEGATGWQIGLGKQQVSLITYDFYHLGVQLADAVHEAYPNGVTVGYVHWINDDLPILLREQGFINELKKYPNIKVIANGGPANPADSNSGYSDPTEGSAEAYTVAFLKKYPQVNLLFAPWEDPPGVGEIAAITSLHLQNKVGLVTMDVGDAGAESLSHGGVIKVEADEDAYDYGFGMAMSVAAAAIGVKEPPFGIVPTWITTPSTVSASWSYEHGPDILCPPADCG
jgi:ribose transport system substrate-binding protein